MPVFAWEGVVRGKIQKGEMEAPSKSAVLARLRQMQVKPSRATITLKVSAGRMWRPTLSSMMSSSS